MAGRNSVYVRCGDEEEGGEGGEEEEEEWVGAGEEGQAEEG
jgi:hypothetical protein